MTNTPMTFEEWYAQHDSLAEYSAKQAWQASQASQQSEIDALKYDLDGYMKVAHASATEIMKQAKTIAELKRQISAKDSLIYSYREMEADCTKQAQTISELVDCLEEILIDTNEGQIMHIASEAIAKVKGK